MGSIAQYLQNQLHVHYASLIRGTSGTLGIRLRRHYYQARLKKCGHSVTVCEGVFIDRPDMISVGDGVGISRYCSLQGAYGIEIGDDVLVGPYSLLESVSHIHSDRRVPISRQGYSGAPIIIENGAWIGANVVVLDGVRLGEGCIVGAGAVVTKDVKPYEIVAGVPAKRIGER